jgi:SAM-dependent methyltransferase
VTDFVLLVGVGTAALRQFANVSERQADQAVVAAGHLEHDIVAHGLFGGEPMEVERLLGGFALAIDRDDVGKADSMVPWVVEARHGRVGEVLGHGEWRRVGRHPGKRHGAEVFLTVPHQCFANPLAIEDSTANDHPADRSTGALPEQHANFFDVTHPVNAHRHSIDVDNWHPRSNESELVFGQPGVVGLRIGGIDVSHSGNDPTVPPAGRGSLPTSQYVVAAGSEQKARHPLWKADRMETDRMRWDERWATVPNSVGATPPDVVSAHPELLDLIPTAGLALDVACGLGAQALWLAERGLAVTALDVSPIAIDRLTVAAQSQGRQLRAQVWDTDEGLPEALTDLAVIVCQRYRSPALYDQFMSRLRVGGVLILTVLSEVGLQGEPGAFHAPAGDLTNAFDRDDVDILLHVEAHAQASIVVRRER